MAAFIQRNQGLIVIYLSRQQREFKSVEAQRKFANEKLQQHLQNRHEMHSFGDCAVDPTAQHNLSL